MSYRTSTSCQRQVAPTRQPVGLSLRLPRGKGAVKTCRLSQPKRQLSVCNKSSPTACSRRHVDHVNSAWMRLRSGSVMSSSCKWSDNGGQNGGRRCIAGRHALQRWRALIRHRSSAGQFYFWAPPRRKEFLLESWPADHSCARDPCPASSARQRYCDVPVSVAAWPLLTNGAGRAADS